MYINIDPDGWRVGDVYHTYEEAESAAKQNIYRLTTIRIQ